jgi:hypothetical protein
VEHFEHFVETRLIADPPNQLRPAVIDANHVKPVEAFDHRWSEFTGDHEFIDRSG